MMINFLTTANSVITGRLLCGLAIFTLAGVQGCASNDSQDFSSTFEKSRSASQTNIDDAEQNENGSDQGLTREFPELSPYRIDAPGISKASADELQLSEVEDIEVSYENLALEDYITHSLANILNVDFVIDPQVDLKGKTVTLSLSTKVSQKKYLAVFKDMLEQHGLAMKLQNGIVFVFKSGQRSGFPEYDYGFGKSANTVPLGSQPVFQVVPVSYIDTQSLAGFIVRLTNATPERMTDPNLIGLRGARNDILRALDVINIVDRPSVLGKSISFLQLQYIPSDQFIEKVTELLSNEGVNTSTALRFTDLSRQNGVVVHSVSKELIKRVEYWKEQIDNPESTDERQYFMYYPENMEAMKLSEVLEKLVGIMDGGSTNTTSRSNNSEASGMSAPGTARQSDSRSSSTASSGSTKDFSYVVDENRNVIVIYSTASKYKSLLPLLKKLDVSPPQVLIEAKLIEITLTDQFSQGIEWSLLGGANQRSADYSRRSLAGFAADTFSYTLSGVDYDIALKLAQSQDRLKVLSSPRIVVANGEKATINVGTEIPVLSTQSADVDSERVLQSIQYRSTGVDLTVKPTVNSSNVISLELTQNVSEQSENQSSGIDSPLILNRSFDTSVVTNSGQTLVLGGLIRENNSSEDLKIPLLGDIPVLGRLFSSKSKSNSRTELVVLITPRIISNSSDIDELRNLFIDELTLFEE